MRKTDLFFHSALIFFYGLIGCFATRNPFLQLFLGQNWNDNFVFLQFDTPDLSTLNFDNQAHSYLLHGTAILYEHKNYNHENPDGSVILMTFTSNTWINGSVATVPTLPTTSSVRFIGDNSGGMHFPSVTLFSQNNFGGNHTKIISTSDQVLLRFHWFSLVSIGVESWTFYNELNYTGIAHCVKGSSDLHGVRFFPNSTALGFSLREKRSVKEGCFS